MRPGESSQPGTCGLDLAEAPRCPRSMTNGVVTQTGNMPQQLAPTKMGEGPPKHRWRNTAHPPPRASQHKRPRDRPSWDAAGRPWPRRVKLSHESAPPTSAPPTSTSARRSLHHRRHSLKHIERGSVALHDRHPPRDLVAPDEARLNGPSGRDLVAPDGFLAPPPSHVAHRSGALRVQARRRAQRYEPTKSATKYGYMMPLRSFQVGLIPPVAPEGSSISFDTVPPIAGIPSPGN